MRPRIGIRVGAAIGLALAAACSSEGSGGGEGSATSRPGGATTSVSGAVTTAGEVREGVPPEVVDGAEDWPLANRDYENSRAVLDGPIDSSTIDALEVVWRYDLPGASSFGNAATTPLVLGDVVYVEDLKTTVHAVGLATGEEMWTAGGGGNVFGPTGVAVGWGKVFATKVGPTGRGSDVVAFDMGTGRELWSTDITARGGEVNVQPSVYGGLVFASTSGFGGNAHRGAVAALDAATGEIVWTFETVESDDLWGDPELNGGAGTWYPPAVDTERGVAYFGTGNPYPFPGAPGFPNGSSRPGDNRWTDSTIALDVETGELLWGFQAFEHDLFDRDQVLASLLEVGGRRIVVSTGKGGVVFGLDAESGEQLWSVQVGEHENDELTAIEGPITVLPGAQGGVLTPIAVADETVYASVVNAPTDYAGPEESSSGFTTRLGAMPSDLVAIDASNGEIRWDVKIDGDALGGATVVNDLVLTATLTGRILAFDRATGEEVWSMQAAGGINGWPAVAGDTIVWPVGFADPAHLMALRLP